MAYDILTPREKWQQEAVGMTPDDLVKLEEAMIKYFVSNEDNILALQRQYQQDSKGIDVITATEYAIRIDLLQLNQKSKERIRGLEGVLQYMMAVKKAREKNQDEAVGDFEVIQELKTVSQNFRPNYMEEMLVVEGFLEQYARVMQHRFMEIVERYIISLKSA